MENRGELNRDIRSFLNLKEGEMICPDCIGLGILNLDHLPKDVDSWIECKLCHGEGKIDWIENIVGKKPRAPYGSNFKYDRERGKVVRVD